MLSTRSKCSLAGKLLEELAKLDSLVLCVALKRGKLDGEQNRRVDAQYILTPRL